MADKSINNINIDSTDYKIIDTTSNKFDKVKVGNVTLEADNNSDTITLEEGSNITITPNADTDGLTISAKDTTYTAGGAITISSDNVIDIDSSVTTQITSNRLASTTALENAQTAQTTAEAAQTTADKKQDKLTAGDNITISGSTISATDSYQSVAGTDANLNNYTTSGIYYLYLTKDNITADNNFPETSTENRYYFLKVEMYNPSTARGNQFLYHVSTSTSQQVIWYRQKTASAWQDWIQIPLSTSLATVATSGSYNDLIDKLTAGTGMDITDGVITAKRFTQTTIAASTDMNTITAEGRYYANADSSYSTYNKPNEKAGIVQVYSNSPNDTPSSTSYCVQLWYRPNKNKTESFIRVYDGANWGDWKTITGVPKYLIDKDLNSLNGENGYEGTYFISYTSSKGNSNTPRNNAYAKSLALLTVEEIPYSLTGSNLTNADTTKAIVPERQYYKQTFRQISIDSDEYYFTRTMQVVTTATTVTNSVTTSTYAVGDVYKDTGWVKLLNISDIKGTANDITATTDTTNGTVTLDLADTAVEVGSYGLSANATPAYGATFDVPYITVDQKGRITSASTNTVKIPASDNSDTKVTVASSTTNKNYPIAAASSTTLGSAMTEVANSAVTLNPSTGTVTATKFSGSGAGLTNVDAATVSGFTVGKTVPSDAVFTDTTYSAATDSALGLVKLSTDSSTNADDTVLSSKATQTAISSAVSSAYRYIGSVSTVDQINKITTSKTYYKLSSSTITSSATTATGYSQIRTGDIFNVADTGMNYAWTGSAWDALGTSYSAATSTTLGLVKTGDNISNSSGTISVPVATSSTLGVIKSGLGVEITDGVLTTKRNSRRAIVDTSTDMNTILAEGRYYVSADADNYEANHKPNSNAGIVQVYNSLDTDNPGSDGYCVQLWYRPNYQKTESYIRIYNSKWGDWRTITGGISTLVDKDLNTINGENGYEGTYLLSYTSGGGYTNAPTGFSRNLAFLTVEQTEYTHASSNTNSTASGYSADVEIVPAYSICKQTFRRAFPATADSQEDDEYSRTLYIAASATTITNNVTTSTYAVGDVYKAGLWIKNLNVEDIVAGDGITVTRDNDNGTVTIDSYISTGSVSATTDLNTCLTSGLYYVSAASETFSTYYTSLHRPVYGNGLLEVIAYSTNLVVQTFHIGSGSSFFETWTRTYYANSVGWTNWKELKAVTSMSSVTNLNDYVKSGTYFIEGTSTNVTSANNFPETITDTSAAVKYMLYVDMYLDSSNTTRGIQTLHKFSATESVQTIWYRQKTAGSSGWNDWLTIPTSTTAVTHTYNKAVGSATQGVYIASDGTATAMTYSLNKTVPSNAVFTDTNTDTKVNTTLATTSKAYLLGTTTKPTATAAAVETVADTGVYLDTTAGKLTATTFSGALSGNATTATAFSAEKSVALTGDVTGTASSTAGWSVATTLASSGVTAGSYGLSANATPAFGGTFKVPYVTLDAKGRATAASTKTVTVPSAVATSSAAGLMSATDKDDWDSGRYNNRLLYAYSSGNTMQSNKYTTDGTTTGTASLNALPRENGIYDIYGDLTDSTYWDTTSTPANATGARFRLIQSLYNNSSYAFISQILISEGYGRIWTRGVTTSTKATTATSTLTWSAWKTVSTIGTAATGSATKGTYVNANGEVTEMTYSVNKDVPSDAVFTDTFVPQSSTDKNLNNYTTSGIYYIACTKTEVTTDNNWPFTYTSAALTWVLEVISDGTRVIQRLGRIGTVHGHYYRLKTASEWATWQQEVISTPNTDTGSATQGTYIAADGTATKMTYSLNKTVPSDAVFTDTQGNLIQNTSTSLDYVQNRYILGVSGNSQTAIVHAGTPVYFIASVVDESSTDYVYKWYVSTTNGLTWTASSSTGYGTKRLTVSATNVNAAHNGYRYKCLITSTANKSFSVYTDEALLVVAEANAPMSVQSNTGRFSNFLISSKRTDTKDTDTNVTTTAYSSNMEELVANGVLPSGTTGSTTEGYIIDLNDIQTVNGNFTLYGTFNDANSYANFPTGLLSNTTATTIFYATLICLGYYNGSYKVQIVFNERYGNSNAIAVRRCANTTVWTDWYYLTSNDTAVQHTKDTAVGSATQGVYIAADGTATKMSYTIAKSVPSTAVFTDTTIKTIVPTATEALPLIATTSAELSSTNATTQLYGSTNATVTKDGAIKAASVTATGAVSAASMSATGAVTAASFSGSYLNPTVIYGTCKTTYSDTEKVVAVSDSTYTLKTGDVIFVRFSYYNTAASPTLNVNSTGAKSICVYGTTAASTNRYWNSGSVVRFVYDGTNFIMENGTSATTAYYGVTKLSDSVSTTSSVLAATPTAVKTAYDKAVSKAAISVSGTSLVITTGS